MFGAAGTLETEVLVVGAGPVGLALAGDLGWRGRDVVVVERGDGSIFQPKMDMVGIRTMEFCRRWGIVGDVEASPYARDYPQDNVYLTALTGWELGREPMPAMADEVAPPESPQHRERCPQNMFDPILQRFALSQAGVRILYRHAFESFTEDDAGVTATIRDQAGDRIAIRARYLVGCDGGRSRVREQLGIAMHGRGVLTYTTNVIFRCPGFNGLHDKRPGYRYMFLDERGVWGTLVAIDGRDHWRMSIVGSADDQRTRTEDELRAAAWRMLGRPFEHEIRSILPWVRTELVAETYGRGRAWIAGDACHLTSPTGGLGMNTGIGDAVDIAWKLDALLAGWGGSGLLDAYTIERRPVATRITRFSTGNLQTMQSITSDATLFEDSATGAATRARVGAAMTARMQREWFANNMHLGYRYVDSPILRYDASEDPATIAAESLESAVYRPSTRPGARAPHAWIDRTTSTLDWFGRGFVLVCPSDRADAAGRFVQAWAERDVPLEVRTLDDPGHIAAYTVPWVLVRPDGHVAWRGEMLPDAASLVRVVTGNA